MVGRLRVHPTVTILAALMVLERAALIVLERAPGPTCSFTDPAEKLVHRRHAKSEQLRSRQSVFRTRGGRMVR